MDLVTERLAKRGVTLEPGTGRPESPAQCSEISDNVAASAAVTREVQPDHIPSVSSASDSRSASMDALAIPIGTVHEADQLIPFGGRFEPLETETQLHIFNKRLGSDGVFRHGIFEFIICTVGSVNGYVLMHRALDLLFSKHLLASCSWTGTGTEGNIPFYIFYHVHELFRDLGSVKKVCRIPDRCVRCFFMTHLYRAKGRLRNLKRKGNVDQVHGSMAQDLSMKRPLGSPSGRRSADRL